MNVLHGQTSSAVTWQVDTKACDPYPTILKCFWFICRDWVWHRNHKMGWKGQHSLRNSHPQLQHHVEVTPWPSPSPPAKIFTVINGLATAINLTIKFSSVRDHKPSDATFEFTDLLAVVREIQKWRQTGLWVWNANVTLTVLPDFDWRIFELIKYKKW